MKTSERIRDIESEEIVDDYNCQVCGCKTKEYKWLIESVKKLTNTLQSLKRGRGCFCHPINIAMGSDHCAECKLAREALGEYGS